MWTIDASMEPVSAVNDLSVSVAAAAAAALGGGSSAAVCGASPQDDALVAGVAATEACC